jgi:hypothetical protein
MANKSRQAEANNTGQPLETPVRRPQKGAVSRSRDRHESSIDSGPPETPNSNVRKNPPRSARRDDISYNPAAKTPRTARKRIAISTFGFPDIPSPGRLFPIQEDDNSKLDGIQQGLRQITLDQSTKEQAKPAKAAKEKAARGGKSTLRVKSSKAVAGQNNNEDIEARDSEAEETNFKYESDNETAGVPVATNKRKLTPDQIRLKNRVLEFKNDKQWANSSIWEVTPQDIQVVANEIKKLSEEGERLGIFQRMYMLMLQALTFRQAMEGFSEAAMELNLEWVRKMKETMGMRDNVGTSDSESDSKAVDAPYLL